MSKLQDKMQVAQETSVEFLSFSGGGAKGAIYSGVYQSLKESSVIDGVKAVAGSSAGAITAAFIATGIKAEDFEKLSKETNLKGLLGKGFLINKDGNPLYELLAKTISQNVSNFLKEVDLPEICEKRINELLSQQEINNTKIQALVDKEILLHKDIIKLKGQESAENNIAKKEEIHSKILLVKKEIKDLEKDIKTSNYAKKDIENNVNKIQAMLEDQWSDIADLRERCENGDKIYFKDLAVLRAIDPIRFKDLVITSVKKETGELVIFSPTNSPDVEIALAARASASIPIIFKNAKIDGEKYVDGGYRDNIPTKYFADNEKEHDIEDITDDKAKIAEAKKQGRTLAFAFGSDDMNDTLNMAIYSSKEKFYDPSVIVKFLMDVVFKFLAKVGGVFKYSETEKATYQELRDDPLNVVPLDTKAVGTLSFDAAQEKAEYLHYKGQLTTDRHLVNHGFAHGINEEKLIHKEFLLSIYEKVDSRSLLQSWGDKIDKSRAPKVQELFELGKFEDKDILGQYILLAATKRGSNEKFSNDTNTMIQVVKTLNDAFTPLKIREEFVKLLNIDIQKSPEFDANKIFDDNMAKFKFDKDHFNTFLEKNKDNPNLAKGVGIRI